MAALFAITLFLSALLLFWVQPMLAKMVLPLLGGTPAVWNTCMVFFQTMLLLGYAYAHWLGSRRSLRRQLIIHITLLLGAALALPLHLAPGMLSVLPSESNPVWWLLGCLALSAGLPFWAVATNGPLLQLWFSRSDHPAAKDPYFLYAASNLGSLAALLGFPLLLEPWLRTGVQSQCWAAFYIVLIGLIAGCGLSGLWRGRGAAQSKRGRGLEDEPNPASDSGGRARASRPRWKWCLLAFVPSSLMLGVTTYLTTDIASIPLLWVLPLSLYLVTFILAFGGRSFAPGSMIFRLLPIGTIALVFMLLTEATQPAWLLIALHLGVFFLAAMACHGQLAAARPDVTHLTEFYLWLSVGGVLGGLFNALLAPVLFRGVAEYPAVLILACWLIPAVRPVSATRAAPLLRWAVPAGAALLTLVLGAAVLPSTTLPLPVRSGVAFGIPLLVCFAAVDRPARFALSLGAVLLATSFSPGIHGKPLWAERNFYGVLRVTRDPAGPFYRLVHGNTIHGRQWIDRQRRPEALSYYHCTGPLGQVFDVFRARPARPQVGVIGLGAGSMACYAQATEDWTFYEINPAVLAVARNTNYFTFLNDCPARRVDVVLGDARLRLREAPPEHYGLLVIDAFSSDAIPLHLITREALQLYLSKLAPGGLLAFHISNRCLELEGVLGDLAQDAGLICHAQDESDPSPIERDEGKDQSHWLIMCRQRADLGRLARDSRWLPIKPRVPSEVWTDDFSNLISVFKWY